MSNFPNKWVAYVLRAIIFPFGTWLTKPSDELDHKVAALLQTPGEARNRLGKWQYLTRDGKNVFGILEQTLEDIIACEPIYKKVCKAINKELPFYNLVQAAKLGLEANAITAKEAQILIKAEEGRKIVISVDDFESNELKASA